MKPHSIHVKKWRQNNPLKCRAHWMVNAAIRSGQLIKQPCSICGAEKAQAHHGDYNKPLDIKWLCVKCHKQEHGHVKQPKRINIKDPSTGKTRTITVKKSLVLIDGMLRLPNKLYSVNKTRVIELRETGLSFSKIGRLLGISKATAYKIYANPPY